MTATIESTDKTVSAAADHPLTPLSLNPWISDFVPVRGWLLRGLGGSDWCGHVGSAGLHQLSCVSGVWPEMAGGHGDVVVIPLGGSRECSR